jgi:2,5-diketo-D-gluconate reductase B
VEYVEAGAARIPKLGLGTWQNTGPECAETVETALELGYRHVDTAQVYDNEAQVGQGIARADVDREEVFLTTKVWRSNLRGEDLRESVRESLADLGVDCVDLLLVHWPHPRVDIEESLAAMADLRASGACKHVGVSNFTRRQLDRARSVSSVPLVTDQVLYHPYPDQSELRAYCREEGLALTAYSPLARGDAVSDERLARIGDRYDKTAAQVALRWLTQQAPVVAIPKSTSPQHLEANLAALEFSLTDAEMERIAGLDGSLGIRLRNRLPSVVRRIPF